MESEIVKSNCLKRWGELDNKLTLFKDQFDNWISQFPDDYCGICYKLLNKFEYYSRKNILSNLEMIHTSLLNNYGIDYDKNSILTFIKSSDGRVNSSTEYVVEFKNLTKINKHSIIDDIYQITGDWVNIKNIVYIDDCSGSGETFKKYLKRNINKMKDKQIFLIVIHLMKEGKENIEAYAKEKGLNLHIFSINVFDKAFSNFIFTEFELDDSLKKTIDISKRFGICKNQILGFENSQALMAFYSGTPNNTIGYFIKNTERYNALFPRDYYKRPDWKSSSKSKKERMSINHQASIKESANE